MSSFVQDCKCSKCNSDNAYYETFSDDEEGHIMGCEDCGYYDVYREDAETREVIEEYKGYDHYYAQDDKDNKEETNETN